MPGRPDVGLSGSLSTGLARLDLVSGSVTTLTAWSGPIFLKRNDRAPSLIVQLLNVPVDPSGATVKFLMRPKGGTTPKVNASASFVGSPTITSCVVKYDWQAADVDTSGEFEAEFEMTVGGLKTTFPNTGFVGVSIVDDIA